MGAAGGGGAAIGSGAIGGGGGPATGRIAIDGLRGGEYGAGGGGGGVVAPGLRESPDSPDMVGEGFSDGLDGQPGGATSFGALVVAPGGAAGLAGNPNRSTAEALAVSSLMAVNSVELRDGLAFVLGGGHQWVNFTNLPAEHRIALLLVIEAPDVPIGAYSMHVDVLDPSGASRRRASFPVDITITGRVTRITRVLELTVVVDAVGVGLSAPVQTPGSRG